MEKQEKVFYINEELAISIGATHYGTSCGIPVWIFIDTKLDGDFTKFAVVPKLQILTPLANILNKYLPLLNRHILEKIGVEPIANVKQKGKIIVEDDTTVKPKVKMDWFKNI